MSVPAIMHARNQVLVYKEAGECRLCGSLVLLHGQEIRHEMVVQHLCEIFKIRRR